MNCTHVCREVLVSGATREQEELGPTVLGLGGLRMLEGLWERKRGSDKGVALFTQWRHDDRFFDGKEGSWRNGEGGTTQLGCGCSSYSEGRFCEVRSVATANESEAMRDPGRRCKSAWTRAASWPDENVLLLKHEYEADKNVWPVIWVESEEK